MASQAKKKKLEQDLKDAQDELNNTKRDHANDMREQGYDKMSEDLSKMLEDTEYEISHNADKQLEIITSMLDKVVGQYQAAYGKINSIISSTGWVGSTDFNNNQSQLSSQEGALNQNASANKSQSETNKTPSSSASGTKTDPIKSNDKANSDYAQEIIKPENVDNRPVAEILLDQKSVSVQEGSSVTVKVSRIRPNDAKNKTINWKSSNTSVATVSNGTIKGVKPGTCTVQAIAADGHGANATVSVTVTKKPDPPKPAPKPTTPTKQPLRVGSKITYTGAYYSSSWGTSPVGNYYSGVKNGVVIDSYSSSEYGGQASYTGDYKIHIKSADGKFGDLGWIKLSQIQGYAKGTTGVKEDQIAWTDEEGREMVIRADGAKLRKLNKGDGVVPHTETEKLMAFADKNLDGKGNVMFADPVSAVEGMYSNVVNTDAIRNISNMAKSVVNNAGGDSSNITQHFDKMFDVVIEGNITKDSLPGLKDILRQSYEYTSDKLYQESKKLGNRNAFRRK